jgi:chromosome segregation ATPase
MNLPLGGVLGTAELAAWVANRMRQVEQEMERLRSEMASVKLELEAEKKLTLSLAQGFDQLSRQHRAELAALKRLQERTQDDMALLQGAAAELQVERRALEDELRTLRAQVAEIRKQLEPRSGVQTR